MDWFLSILQTQLNRIISIVRPPPPKEWSDLPDLVIENVIKHLDLPSRCRLQQCSKRDQLIINRCPTYLPRIGFTQTDDEDLNLKIRYFENDDRKEWYLDYSGDITEDVDYFLRIAMHPRSRFGKFALFLLEQSGDEEAIKMVTDFFEYFTKKLNDLAPNKQINTEAFGWLSEGFEDEKYILPILKRLSPKHLKQIKLGSDLPQSILLKIVDTDQWKNCERLFTHSYGEGNATEMIIPIEHFIHANQIKLEMSDVNEKDACIMIKSFRTKKRSIGSFFCLVGGPPLTQFDANEIISRFDVQLDRVQIFNHDDSHFLIFQLKWCKETVLFVRIRIWQVEGAICRQNNIINDFVTEFPSYIMEGVIEEQRNYFLTIPYFARA